MTLSGPDKEGKVQRVGVGVVVLATLAISSGCGGSSSSDETATFKKNVAPVLDQFRSTSQAIGTEIQQASSQTDTQFAAAFHGLADKWQSQVNKLQSLKPPANLATAFNSLKTSASRAGSDLSAVASAADSHSVAAAKQAVTNLVNDITSAKSSGTTISSKLGIS